MISKVIFKFKFALRTFGYIFAKQMFVLLNLNELSKIVISNYNRRNIILYNMLK